MIKQQTSLEETWEILNNLNRKELKKLRCHIRKQQRQRKQRASGERTKP